jgi:hypothetical protein
MLLSLTFFSIPKKKKYRSFPQRENAPQTRGKKESHQVL